MDLFGSVGTAKPRRGKFDLSHSKRFTGDTYN